MGLSEGHHLFGILTGGIFHRHHRRAEILLHSGEVSADIIESGTQSPCGHCIHTDVSTDCIINTWRSVDAGGDIKVFLSEYDQPADRRRDIFADQRVYTMRDDMAAQ